MVCPADPAIAPASRTLAGDRGGRALVDELPRQPRHRQEAAKGRYNNRPAAVEPTTMLSYRHAFHAGNHADVLKHLAQVLVLDYLLQAKPGKPLCYIDTHAGPGGYALLQGYATQNEEFRSGISPLWRQPDLPAPLARYLQVVASFNPAAALTHYPGSPAIDRQLLRGTDRLELCELHPAEFDALRRWSKGDRRIRLRREDGLDALAALLPPRERRALILLDPSYELKTDYTRVPDKLRAALRRFATGVYLLWYPLLDRADSHTLAQTLGLLPGRHLQAELQVKAADQGGLYGGGVFVINPPWVLERQLRECLVYLRRHLGQDAQARYSLTTSAQID